MLGWIKVRLRRQERLTGEDPLHLTALIHQAALEQRTGSDETMRVHIIHFAGPMLNPIVWHESVATRGLIDDLARVRELRILFERQLESALSREDSLSLIEQVADGIA